MNTTDRRQRPTLRREALLLAALAAVALVIAWTLTAGGAAQAGPPAQDSPLTPSQEHLSPLIPTTPPATAEPAQPTQAATATPQPPAIPAASAGQPPVPIGVVIGVMVVIGLAALIIGLRRR